MSVVRKLMSSPGRFAFPVKNAIRDDVIYWEPPLNNIDGTAFEDAIGYEVWRHTTAEGVTDYDSLQDVAELLTSPHVGAEERMFQDVTAVAGTTYWYWVVAKGSQGQVSDLQAHRPRIY
jgi:hypothetical protein